MIINKREIKFRAYNRDWNMTLPVDEIKFENGEAVSVSVTIKASDYDHEGEWADYIVGDEITIEQFTGLKDKNGKEIYEGDIVVWEHNDEKLIDSITYNGALFALDRQIIPLNSIAVKMFIEVIGNIHENPELLK